MSTTAGRVYDRRVAHVFAARYYASQLVTYQLRAALRAGR